MMGRPPIFEDPDQLALMIGEYFSYCRDKNETITISGLAFWLGFESRQSFYDYEKKENFSYIIKRARLQVEMAYEERLDSKNPTGAIFALKNMGWKDKHEVESTVKDERIDESKLSTDDLRVLADIQRRGRTSSKGVR